MPDSSATSIYARISRLIQVDNAETESVSPFIPKDFLKSFCLTMLKLGCNNVVAMQDTYLNGEIKK